MEPEPEWAHASRCSPRRVPRAHSVSVSELSLHHEGCSFGHFRCSCLHQTCNLPLNSQVVLQVFLILCFHNSHSFFFSFQQGVVTNFEIFRMREKQVPVDVVEMKGKSHCSCSVAEWPFRAVLRLAFKVGV